VRLSLTNGMAKQTCARSTVSTRLEAAGRVEALTATAADGAKVESWLVVPKDASADHPGTVWSSGPTAAR
jgi:cephalosporin-C deacetylase-like acetyl esterase